MYAIYRKIVGGKRLDLLAEGIGLEDLPQALEVFRRYYPGAFAKRVL